MKEVGFWTRVLYGLFDFERGPNAEALIVIMVAVVLLELFIIFKVRQYKKEEDKNGDKTGRDNQTDK